MGEGGFWVDGWEMDAAGGRVADEMPDVVLVVRWDWVVMGVVLDENSSLRRGRGT